MKPFASSALLIFGATFLTASAQQPSSLPAPPPDSSAQTVTVHSRIRSVGAGPGGSPQSLALSNGDTVELGSRFGTLPSNELYEGVRIAATGPSTGASRHRTIDASTLRVGRQTFTATALNAGPGGAPPQPGTPLAARGNAGSPPAGPGAPPPHGPGALLAPGASAPPPPGAGAPPPAGPGAPPPPEAGAPPPAGVGAPPPPPAPLGARGVAPPSRPHPAGRPAPGGAAAPPPASGQAPPPPPAGAAPAARAGDAPTAPTAPPAAATPPTPTTPAQQ